MNDFYRKAIKITIPIVIQNLLSATIASTDVLMLNYVGQSAISSVSLAANYTAIAFMIFFGLGSGAIMLASQYNGKGDIEAIHLTEGIALRFSVLSALILASAALLIPKHMMLVFTPDPELITLGSSYLRVVAASYIFWSFSEIYMAILRSVKRVAICTILNIGGFIINIILNAVFIFGLFGLPKMGVVGVALGTTISRFIVFLGCILVSSRSPNVRLVPSFIFRHNRLLFHDFLHMALPAIINDISWGVAFSLYSAIIGHLSNDAVAAYSLVNVVRGFGTVFCFAVGSATGIILGNIMGEGKLEEAVDSAKRLMKMTLAAALMGSVLILCLIPVMLAFADLTEEATGYLRFMLFVNTVYVFGTAVNTTLITGVFRAGGDSKFGMICDTIDMWCYALPVGFIAAFVLHLPVMAVYVLLCTDEFVKWPWVLGNYFSGKWAKNITRDDLYA